MPVPGPSGLPAAHTHDDGTAAAWLAEVARLELAAIDAFAATEGFATELEAEPTPGVRSLLGLPDATRAQDLLRAIT